MIVHRQVNVDATLLAALLGAMNDDGAHLAMGLLALAHGQVAYGGERLGVARRGSREDADRCPSPVGGHEEKRDALSGWFAVEVVQGAVVLDLDKGLGIAGDGVGDALDLADVPPLLMLEEHLLGGLMEADARAERDDLALELSRDHATVQAQPLRHRRPPPFARSAVVVGGGNRQADPGDHDGGRGGGAFAGAVTVWAAGSLLLSQV